MSNSTRNGALRTAETAEEKLMMGEINQKMTQLEEEKN